MDLFGSIQTFNPLTGIGFIRPEVGGTMISFNQIVMYRPHEQEVQEGTRVNYRTKKDSHGDPVAVRMHLA